MHERTAAGHQKSANGQLCLNYLSHPRGQAHNTRHLAAPRTFFAPWRVVLFWASLNARSTLALRGDARAGLLLRPFSAYPGGSSYPGFRFAPPMGYDPEPLRGLTALGSKLEGPK